MIIKAFFLICFLYIESFFVGNFILAKEKGEKRVTLCVSYGFAGLVGVFAILALPFLLWWHNFKVLYYTALAVGIFMGIDGARKYLQTKAIFDWKFKFNGYKWLAMCLILGQAVAGNFLYHEDDDDGYYIAMSNMAVDYNVIEIDSEVVYNGLNSPNTEDSYTPPVVSWELLIAVWAKMFGLRPVVLAHSILPLILIPVCYMALWNIACLFFEREEQRYLLLIIISLLQIFGGYSPWTTGCFLLLRIWQGKALLVNFIFPMLMESCIRIYKGDNTIKRWIYNLILLFSAIGLSAVGLQLGIIYYFVLGLPLLILTLVKDRKHFGTLLSRAVLSAIPSAIVIGLSFLYVMSTPEGYAQSQTAVVTPWTYWPINALGDKSSGYMILGVVSVGLLCMKGVGTKLEKRVLFGTMIAALCTVLNPLFYQFVVQKVMTDLVYWRLWWCIPINMIIAVSLVEISCKIEKRNQYIVLLLMMGYLLIYGSPVLSEKKEVYSFQNLYKLPVETMEIVDYVLQDEKDIQVLTSEKYARKLRQLNCDVYVPRAYCMSTCQNFISDTDVTYADVYASVYMMNSINDIRIQNALTDLQVKYIVIDHELVLGDNNIYRFDKQLDCGLLVYCAK